MAERKNNYRGQYKVENGLEGSFESYWSRYGVESQDDSVRVLMHAIFDLLSQDIKKSQKSADYNQAIFDMVEMRDLQKALKQVLEQYSEIEESDLKMTTDVVRKRLQASIENEIKNVFDNVTKKLKEANAESEQANKESDTETKVQEQQKPSRDELEKKIRDILGDFFESKKSKNNTEESKSKGKSKKSPGTKRKNKRKTKSNKDGGTAGENYDKNPEKVGKTDSVQENTDVKNEKLGEDDLEKFSKALAREYWRGGNAAEKSSDPIFTSLGRKLRQKISSKGGLSKLLSKFTFGEQQKKNTRKGPFSKDKDSHLDGYSKLAGKLSKYMEKKEKKDKKRFNDKIKNGFKLLRASFSKAIGNVFGMFKFVLTPIGNAMTGMWNTIRHPIKSLQKLLQSGTFGILKSAFSNPKTAHLLGFILSFIYFKFIETPLLKYIVNPIHALSGEIWNLRLKFEKEGPPPIIGKIINIFNGIKQLFEPVEETNFLLGFVYRIAEKIGFSELESLKTVFQLCSNLGGFFYGAIKNIIKNGLFSHFQGAGLIQKMLMIAMAQQGEMQAEILTEKNEHYMYEAAEQVRGPGVAERNIGGSNLKEKDQAIEDYYKIRAEVLDNLPRLEDYLKYLEEIQVEISETDIEDFFRSGMYDESDLKQEFKKITKGVDFENLTKEEKINALTELMRRRGRLAHLKSAIYESDSDAIDQLIPGLGFSNDYLFKEEVMVWENFIDTTFRQGNYRLSGVSYDLNKPYEFKSRQPEGTVAFVQKLEQVPLIQVLRKKTKYSKHGYKEYTVYEPSSNGNSIPVINDTDTLNKRIIPSVESIKEGEANYITGQDLIKKYTEKNPPDIKTSSFRMMDIPKNYEGFEFYDNLDQERYYVRELNNLKMLNYAVNVKKGQVDDLSSNNIMLEESLLIAEKMQNELTNIIYVYDHDEDDGVA